jgi:hypothetical protein
VDRAVTLLRFLPLCVPELGDEIALVSPHLSEPEFGIFNVRKDRNTGMVLFEILRTDGWSRRIDPIVDRWYAASSQDQTKSAH